MPKKEINLLPREEFERKPLGRFLTWALSAGRYIIIFTELIVLIAFFSRFKLDRDLSNLYDRIQQKQFQITTYDDFEAEFRLFQERLKTIKTLQAAQTPTQEMAEAVSQVIPDDVSLDSLSFSQEGLKLSGIALSEAGLSIFVNNLTADKKLTDVSLDSMTRKTGEGIKFSLSAKVAK